MYYATIMMDDFAITMYERIYRVEERFEKIFLKTCDAYVYKHKHHISYYKNRGKLPIPLFLFLIAVISHI
jgi:hypothetical protein